MTTTERTDAKGGTTIIERLRELIKALDRRAPSPGRTGEVDIVRDASALRARALERLTDLEKQAGNGAIVTRPCGTDVNAGEPARNE